MDESKLEEYLRFARYLKDELQKDDLLDVAFWIAKAENELKEHLEKLKNGTEPT